MLQWRSVGGRLRSTCSRIELVTCSSECCSGYDVDLGGIPWRVESPSDFAQNGPKDHEDSKFTSTRRVTGEGASHAMGMQRASLRTLSRQRRCADAPSIRSDSSHQGIRKSLALMATITVLRDINPAPTAGLITSP